jgi:molecular chaperone DnaK
VGYIDANGILNVSAKDKATGKEQSIVIRASSGLGEDEIQRMVKDAEAHAAEDRKFHEVVDARNQAENLIYSTEKTLRDLGDKVEGSERLAIESAISDLRTAIKSDNKEAIEAKTRTLSDLSGKLVQRVYAQTGGESEASGASGGRKSEEEGVVDAEFEEVKDK